MATGRGNGTRTRTVFLPTDFKSAVYANSTIPPYGRSGVDRTHDAGVKVLCLNRLAIRHRTRIFQHSKSVWRRVCPVVISLLTVRRCSPSCRSCYRSVFRRTSTDGSDPVLIGMGGFEPPTTRQFMCTPVLPLNYIPGSAPTHKGQTLGHSPRGSVD